MSELVEITLQRAVVTLAEELSYSCAVEKLNITSAELKKQISGLEKQLHFYIFRPKQKRVELTDEGKIFVRACREFLVQHDRSGQGSTSGTQSQKDDTR